MESDSDSDGSHISATPPTTPKSSPPLPPSLNSKTRVNKSNSNSNSNPSNPTKPPPKQPAHLFSTNLPFQIRKTSDLHILAPPHAIDTLPAGFFSKSASFSKFQRLISTAAATTTTTTTTTSSLNFDQPENRGAPEPSGSSVAERVPPGTRGKRAKQLLPNLVGAADPPSSLPRIKLRKCGSRDEGNFVKLNLNGGGRRKFLNRNWKKRSNYSSNGRCFYRRKRRVKPQNGSEDKTECVLGFEQKKNSVKHCDGELIEKAVMSVREEASDENLVRLLNVVYGFDSFRDGQLDAIRMVLDGKSAMLVLPTGAGKTLCYQIPAMVLPGITLVVSPLLALMTDQLKQLPPIIQGGLLSSSQSPLEVSETLRMLQDGSLKVLFVSPERFLNAEFLSAFTASPPIKLLVIDEAHCVSEWSHNFRPSFMRLKASILRENLNVGCILAMTATATTTTLNSVMTALEIPPSNLIQKAQLRDNLRLSISLSQNRMKDLLLLLKSAPFAEVRSIIIYCKFQSETDMISRYLCDNNIHAKSYHSAIPSKDRSRVQELFCSSKIKVVVATVAFGMGLNKKDVGAVIHYSLPESLEEYVQEIGRAGRDGSLSYCHLFFDDISYFKLRSLMHSDGIDEYAVNKFLCQVFANVANSRGKFCSIIKESASLKFDMKEEVMATILTQLELGEVQYLRLLPQSNVTCTLNFYKTSPELLAEKDVMVSAMLKRSEIKQGLYVFDVPTVANDIGIMTTDLLNWLLGLKLKGEITYELKDPAYCYFVMEVPQDVCSLSVQLTKWLSEVEHCKIQKLDTMYSAALFAVNKCEKVEGCCGSEHTGCLQRKILAYFKEADKYEIPIQISQNSPFLRADIKVFLQSNSHAKFTPRAIARIMHGIASPAYPSTTWSKTHFWGRYTNADFQAIMEAAKAELVNCVGCVKSNV